MPKGRKCAVCGKADGTSTFGFKGALRSYGLSNWRDDKAHPRCVEVLRIEAKSKETTEGKPHVAA